MLDFNSNNIGGQGLLSHRNRHFKINSTLLKTNKYLVETILFDDLIPYLNQVNRNKSSKKAIIKIDIEGFEPFAFQYSKRLFRLYEIEYIFMEWGRLIQETANLGIIKEMLNFLYANDLEPYLFNGSRKSLKLDKSEFQSWPWDIVWKRNKLFY